MKRSALLLISLFVLVPAHAASARSTEVGIADDRILLPGGPRADRAVAEWQKLGVDNVRILAKWSQIAPKKRPPGFNGADPASPGYVWYYLDNAIFRVRRAGMTVSLNVTGPGPVWTSSKPKRRNPKYKPRPSMFRAFVTAVAKRYGDDVDRYILWNEPNIPNWLFPQATCKRGRCTPVAPHLYRSLVRASYPAIKKADPGSKVIIGALAPRGHNLRSSKSVMRPLLFLRQFGCRNDQFLRIRKSACRRFKKVKGDGFAIHPYSGLQSPTWSHPHQDDVSLGAMSRLTKTLDRLQGVAALDPTTRRFRIFVDEYAYQTRPPDRVSGVSLAKQDRWLQQAAYVAWRNPRINLFSQYLWRDEPARRGYIGWQSGLRFKGGKAKPSLGHFDTPFYIDAKRNVLWGQVRPGSGRQSVKVQQRKRKSSPWRTLATVRTDKRGYFTVKRKLRKGSSYRYRAAGATSATLRR